VGVIVSVAGRTDILAKGEFYIDRLADLGRATTRCRDRASIQSRTIAARGWRVRPVTAQVLSYGVQAETSEA
jgi:hypothetical protein